MKKSVFFASVLILGCIVHTMLFAAGSKATGEIELRWASIWVGNDSKAPAIEALVKEFNDAHAGKIKVVIDPQPDYNAYEQKVRTALVARTTPADIFTIRFFYPNASQFYNSDLLMDFTPFLNADSSWKATFDSSALSQAVINGKMKSLPMETAILPIWYNTDALRSAGIAALPKTMNEMYSNFDKLKAAGVFPTSQMTGDTNAWTSMIWFSFFAVSLGGPDVWKKPFTDPAIVQAANLLKKMITDYSTPDAVGLGAGGSGGHFLAGRTAVFANGPWYAGRADLVQLPFFNSIVVEAPPPAGPTNNFMLRRLHGNLCAASTKDKNREAAIMEFIKFITSPESVKRIAEVSGAMFAIKTDYVPTVNLQKQFYDLASKYTTTVIDFEASLGAEPTLEFAQQLGALVLGRITAEEFCALIDKKIER